MPEREQLMELELDQVRKWLEDIFHRSGLEISVVGDVNPDEVIRLAGKYFPDRSGLGEIKNYKNKQPVKFPGGRDHKFLVDTEDNKAAVVVGWLTDDFWDIHRSRRLHVLALVFADRLRVKVREELGVAYSPGAYHFASRVDDGYGLLRAVLTVAPDKVDEVWMAVGQITDDLSANRISADELQRIIAPGKTFIKDMQQTNQYWSGSVLSLSVRHPEQLQWPLTILEDYSSISSKEIHALAVKYLREDNRAGFTVLPAQGQD